MTDMTLVDLSRLQFALTALYHFLFVPLTLGLVFLLGIMETVYVITGRAIWKKMTQYWGVLFGINFAMGVATGVTMEFQFGTNWAYYSHYVGDIFGAPLAIEGLMAFFLEASFVGLFFFAWDKLSKGAHLTVTWLLALGTNLSALWILVANGWMQHPVGSAFNFHTMRMEVSNFYNVLFNPVAQAKFVHTLSAGYVAGAMFVLSISSLFLLKRKHIELAKRSIIVAVAFGLAASLSVVVLGDESGYLTGENQKMKLAAMEGIWRTEPAPAALTLFGIPDSEHEKIRYAVRIPFLLGLLANRSIHEPIQGIHELVERNRGRIVDGLIAYDALQSLKQEPNDKKAQTKLEGHVDNLGYALLLKRYRDDILQSSPAQIQQAAEGTAPKVSPLFWTFRIMFACGFWFIFLFVCGFYLVTRQRIATTPWFLRTALWSLPLPWVAIEVGWFVAEYGRQPWAIDGILPTFLSTSSLAHQDVLWSIGGFVVFYSILAVVDVFLMLKYIKLGPDCLEPTSSNVG